VTASPLLFALADWVSVVVLYIADVETRAFAAVLTMTVVVESSLGRLLLTDAWHLSGAAFATA
jgi:hypothetical protein